MHVGEYFMKTGQSHPPRRESCSNILSCAPSTLDIAADAAPVPAKHSWSNTARLWKLHVSTAGLLKLAPGDEPSHYKIPHFLWWCIGGIRNLHTEQLMSLDSGELSWFLMLTDNKKWDNAECMAQKIYSSPLPHYILFSHVHMRLIPNALAQNITFSRDGIIIRGTFGFHRLVLEVQIEVDLSALE